MISSADPAEAAAVFPPMPGNAVFKHVRGSAGNTIRVAVAGQGPLVLMVHGFPDLWFSWRHQIEPVVNAGFTAAAMDVRGYGGSDKPENIESYTLMALANDVAAVIEGLGHSSAILIGHDWGAQQVYTASLLHPEKVSAGVGLSSTAGNFIDRKPSASWATLYGEEFLYHRYFWTPGIAEAEIMRNPRRFLRFFYHGLSGEADSGSNPLRQPAGTTTLLDGLAEPPEFFTWLTAEELGYCAQSFIAGGITAPLNRYRAVDLDVDQLRPYADRRIEQPALWIGGGRDPARWMIPNIDRYLNYSPVERFADMRGKVIVDTAGHWIAQEAPSAVNACLIPFLREQLDSGVRFR
jgi:pimeloyl-ACP methyl ester carboxylesterase